MYGSTGASSLAREVSKIPNDRVGQAATRQDAAWSFDASDYPSDERGAAWAEAMRRLQLPFADPARGGDAVGTVLAVTSPMGFQFALVSGGAQTIAGKTPGAEPGLWLALLIEGCARLETADNSIELDDDTLIYGATGVDAALHFEGPFRQLYVRIPRVAIDARLLAPLAARVSTIEPDTMASHGLLAILHSFAASLGAHRPGDPAPMESALIELLVPVLASDGGDAARGGATGLRARQFERICRMVETRLGDPQLTVHSIAALEGVSVRYLQQLFARSGQTVTGYVKGRRLERAKAELESPLHSQLSITEIGFRWGFSQSAHFSRAYRERFGEAPRESRNRARKAGQAA